ncbi:hypothetical protein G3N57_06065 [Paraburkholderia sp. Se-20369]|nr:hypothetical protein [Paraburkholderia sp. Se-20369]
MQEARYAGANDSMAGTDSRIPTMPRRNTLPIENIADFIREFTKIIKYFINSVNHHFYGNFVSNFDSSERDAA